MNEILRFAQNDGVSQPVNGYHFGHREPVRGVSRVKIITCAFVYRIGGRISSPRLGHQ